MKSFKPLIIILMAVAAIAPAAARAETPDAVQKTDSTALPPKVAELIAAADEYISRPYLDMEQSQLEKMKMQLAEYDYTQAADACEKVSNTLSLWHEIDGYKRLLYVPFQYDKIGSARARIYEMQDEMSPAQYDEIYEQIDSPLSRYYHGVKFFQEVLITRFNEMADAARKAKNISEVRSIFTTLLKEPDVKENIEKRIQPVPWLNKKFQDYYSYIMNRQSSPRGPVAQEIMKISLEPGAN